MCLLIDNRVRNNHHKEDGYCIGYKVLKINNNSPYQGKSYSIGWQAAVLQQEEFACEVDYGEVNYGLHLFLNKKEAMMDIKDWAFSWGHLPNQYKIIKVYYSPKDVIAYGTYSICGISTKNVVVKKLLVKSLKDIG